MANHFKWHRHNAATISNGIVNKNSKHLSNICTIKSTNTTTIFQMVKCKKKIIPFFLMLNCSCLNIGSVTAFNAMFGGIQQICMIVFNIDVLQR